MVASPRAAWTWPACMACTMDEGLAITRTVTVCPVLAVLVPVVRVLHERVVVAGDRLAGSSMYGPAPAVLVSRDVGVGDRLGAGDVADAESLGEVERQARVRPGQGEANGQRVR